MSSILRFAGAAALLVDVVEADFYMHNPAGGNDRNRERNQNRNNDNRLFDSQNNGNGGYPWRGDRELTDAPDPMVYYEGSELLMDWTLQHACGPDPSTYCQVVIQYACEEYTSAAQPATTGPNTNDLIGVGNSGGIRDGYPGGAALQDAGGNNGAAAAVQYKKASFNTNNNDGTNTIPFNANNPSESAETEYGMHETFGFYKECTEVQRNKGLYTADQNLNRNDARSTRQNPNGNRRGLECPEERDYYPSWHPSPWKDAAILASSEEFCPYFQSRSQNTVDRYYCSGATGAQNNKQPISQQACENAGGTWNTVLSWDAQGYALGAPECMLHATSRQNHLGNAGSAYSATAAGTKEAMASYPFKIPTMKDGIDHMMCVVRARYNISTNDYESMKGMDAAGGAVFDQNDNNVNNGNNNNNNGNQPSGARPLYNRPYVTPFAGESNVGIALNTDQSGRTFQDRSYVFKVARRPAGIDSSAKIVNLNTRGARGNIVQSYPRVEYDWAPGDLKLESNDWLHLQWSGSDFNTQRNPNNGEGWQFSDRSNMIEAENENQQFPMAQSGNGFFTYEEAVEVGLQGQEALLQAKGETCGEYDDNTANEDNNPTNCGKLNFAKAHFQLGGLTGSGLKSMNGKVGSYSFVDTRNNNFSNRSQKLGIVVEQSKASGGFARLSQAVGSDGGAVAIIVIIVVVALVVIVAVLGAVGVVAAVVAFKLKKSSGTADDDEGIEAGTFEEAPEKPRGGSGPPPKPGRSDAPAKPAKKTARA